MLFSGVFRTLSNILDGAMLPMFTKMSILDVSKSSNQVYAFHKKTAYPLNVSSMESERKSGKTNEQQRSRNMLL